MCLICSQLQTCSKASKDFLEDSRYRESLYTIPPLVTIPLKTGQIFGSGITKKGTDAIIVWCPPKHRAPPPRKRRIFDKFLLMKKSSMVPPSGRKKISAEGRKYTKKSLKNGNFFYRFSNFFACGELYSN